MFPQVMLCKDGGYNEGLTVTRNIQANLRTLPGRPDGTFTPDHTYSIQLHQEKFGPNESPLSGLESTFVSNIHYNK